MHPKPDELGEQPERWDLWRESLLRSWGGELPGPGVVERALARRALLPTRVEELPPPHPSRLAMRAKGRGAAWAGGRPVPVAAVDDPRPRSSFGLVSRAFEVTPGGEEHAPIDIVLPLAAKRGHVIAGSVRLFRWDERRERFDLVPFSAGDEARGLAWARVREGGVFVAIGFPDDPRIRDTLTILDRLAPYRRALKDPRAEAAFNERICQLILCAPDFASMPLERLGDDWLEPPRDPGGHVPPGDRPRPPGGGGVGNVCDFCLGLPSGGWVPPEIDLGPRPGHGPFRPLPATSCPAWTSLGPANVTGVILGLAAHPIDARVLYAGAQYGGVWKTVDGGASWRPTMDRELNLDVSALGLCRASPDVVYAAMDGNARGNDMDLYRSVDGAASWVLRTSVQSILCRAIAVHPTQPDTVYVAGNAGLHLSLDGGASWVVRTVTVDGAPQANIWSTFDGLISDVALDPVTPSTVYIAVASRGVFKTTDGGGTWHRVGANVTFTVRGDDGAAVSSGLTGAYRTLLDVGEDTRPGRNGTQFVVAKVQGTILTSPDGGATWRVLPGLDHGWDGQNYWCSCVAVCPADQDVIVAGGDHIDLTENASAAAPTWASVPSLHVDQQAIAFARSSPDDFYFANDGYVGKATGRGAAVASVSRGLVASQCFTVAVSQTPQLVVGCSTYHTGTLRTGRASFATWETIDGPEGGPFEIDPTDEKVMYGSPWGASLRRSTDGGTTWTPLSGGINVGSAPGAPREAYVALLAIRPDAPSRLYASAFYGRLHFSDDRGTTWDYVKQAGGAALLIDGIGARESTAGAFAFAPSDTGHAYLGTVNGHLWRTATAATTAAGWEEIAPPYPASLGRPIGALAVDPADPDVVWVGYSAVGVRALWRGTRRADGTFAWVDRSGLFPSTSLPELPISGVIVDPLARRRVFVATKVGVFVAEDAGDWWRSFNEGLPNVEVAQLRLRRSSRTLYAAAYGRGIFERPI